MSWADQYLTQFQGDSESRMTDTCRITHQDQSGEQVWDPATGTYVYPTVTVYEGKCRMPSRGASASASSAGPETWNVGEFPLSLPFTPEAEAVGSGMKVEWLTSAHNPALVGRVFTVAEPLLSSQPTALRWKIKAAV